MTFLLSNNMRMPSGLRGIWIHNHTPPISHQSSAETLCFLWVVTGFFFCGNRSAFILKVKSPYIRCNSGSLRLVWQSWKRLPCFLLCRDAVCMYSTYGAERWRAKGAVAPAEPPPHTHFSPTKTGTQEEEWSSAELCAFARTHTHSLNKKKVRQRENKNHRGWEKGGKEEVC